MNFNVDIFISELCDSYNYPEVLETLILNTCYHGYDYQTYDTKLPYNGVTGIYVTVQFLTGEFFYNSQAGVLLNLIEIVGFVLSFVDLDPKKGILIFPWNDSGEMQELQRGYERIFQYGSRDVISGYEDEYTTSNKEYDRNVIHRIFEDLNNQLNELIGGDDISHLESANPEGIKSDYAFCRKIYGSDFYEQLLLIVRRIVSPTGRFTDAPVRTRNIIFTDYGILERGIKIFHDKKPPLARDKLFTPMALCKRVPQPLKLVRFTHQSYKELTDLYANNFENIGKEGRVLMNMILVLSGCETKHFTDLLQNSNKNKLPPGKMFQSIFAKFDDWCNRTIILDAIPTEHIKLPENVYEFMKNELKNIIPGGLHRLPIQAQAEADAMQMALQYGADPSSITVEDVKDKIATSLGKQYPMFKEPAWEKPKESGFPVMILVGVGILLLFLFV